MFFKTGLISPLIDAAAREDQQPVFYSGKSVKTAAEILEASKHLANQLALNGMKEGDAVVIAIKPGIDFILFIYATVILKVKAAIIDPEMGVALYKAKFKQLQPAWAFVDTHLLLLQEYPILRFAYFKLADKPVSFPKFGNLKIIGHGPKLPIIQPYIHFSKLLNAPVKEIELTPSADNYDYLITYTSGTIDEPKGVLHSVNSLQKSIKLLSTIIDNKANDIMGTYLPHFALLGIGAQLPIYLYDPKLSVEKKLKFFRENRISILFGPPSDFLPMIKHCEKRAMKLPDTLTHIMLGSAPVHQSFLKRLVAVCFPTTRITVLYGMTENLVVSTMDGREKLNYKGHGDILGKPVEGVTLRVSEDGELQIKSDQLYSRYFHQDGRNEFHSTGDLAEINAEGEILLMGRKKEMIIRSNTNIYPALYEGTIKKIPGVEEVAMVGIYNLDKEDEDVYLAVETSEPVTEAFIRDRISYGEFQVEKNALPDFIIFMPIPRKGRQNKIDRSKIVADIKAGKR